MTTTAPADIARLMDRLEIQEVMYRYARGVDRKDWELVRSAYHPDAHDDHGAYRGDIDGFIASLEKRHATLEQSMHLIANIIIEFTGPDSALVESYYTTFQRLAPEAGAARHNYLHGKPIGDDMAMQGQSAGRYLDHFERRDGAWRVARRAVVFEVFKGEAVPRGGGLNPDWTLQRRDQQDPVLVARREAGLPPISAPSRIRG